METIQSVCPCNLRTRRVDGNFFSHGWGWIRTVGNILERRPSTHRSDDLNQRPSHSDYHQSAPQSDCWLDYLYYHTNDRQNSKSHRSLIHVTRKHVHKHDKQLD